MKIQFFAVLPAAFLLSNAAWAQNSRNTRPPVETMSSRPAPRPTAPATPITATSNEVVAVPSYLSPDSLSATLATAERTQNADDLLIAYGQAVTDPVLARIALGQLLSNYYSLRNQARSADQATQAVAEASLRFQVLQAAQNQVLIQQNQQILRQNERLIALMEANALRR